MKTEALYTVTLRLSATEWAELPLSESAEILSVVTDKDDQLQLQPPNWRGLDQELS
jgi:hypothetical protein